MNHRLLFRCVLSLVSLCQLMDGFTQIPVDLSKFDKKSGVQVTVQEKALALTWPANDTEKATVFLNLEKGKPLFQSIQIQQGKEAKAIVSQIDPAFLLTVGKRDLVSQNGWNIFFDKTAYLPSQSYVLQLNKQRAAVTTDGSQTRITIAGLTAGPFTGSYEITLFTGSLLLNIAAVLTTPLDSLAILYDAGLVSQVPAWEKLYWADPEAFVQSVPVEEKAESQVLAVKYRTIIGQSSNGSVALFPPPHQYFYPLDNCYNLKHTWYGSNYRNLVSGYGMGIRHEPLGDRRWVPWFNAPPHTKQRLNFFCLLSSQKDGKVLETVKQFTHGDTYQPLPGYYTLSSHFHQEHTDDVLTHKPLPALPGFVQAFRKTGVNIVHLGEFHGPGSPKGPEAKRWPELQTEFEECARLSGGNFLLLPGEEPNNFFGGHWMNLFPKPVYWVMQRSEGQPFVEEIPPYGKVYRVGSKEDMLKLLEVEKGLAWTAHARTKGSTGYPDKYKQELFYQSPHFLGAAWKAMPADLSEPRLGKRVLDLMDDMANWGLKKYVLAEADLFKIEPSYELYGHLNVNYLQLDHLPTFAQGWHSIVEALQQGKFFVSTGEVLLPSFTVNGKTAGQTLTLEGSGKATIHLNIEWTFPLQFVEIISGDGKRVYRERISLTATEAFGKKQYTLPVQLKDRRWVRVEVWDAAANGAFTQIVWLE